MGLSHYGVGVDLVVELGVQSDGINAAVGSTRCGFDLGRLIKGTFEALKRKIIIQVLDPHSGALKFLLGVALPLLVKVLLEGHLLFDSFLRQLLLLALGNVILHPLEARVHLDGVVNETPVRRLGFRYVFSIFIEICIFEFFEKGYLVRLAQVGDVALFDIGYSVFDVLFEVVHVLGAHQGLVVFARHHHPGLRLAYPIPFDLRLAALDVLYGHHRTRQAVIVRIEHAPSLEHRTDFALHVLGPLLGIIRSLTDVQLLSHSRLSKKINN